MSYELFVLWSLPFWALLVLESAFLFWAVSSRRGFWALASLIPVALAVQFLGDFPVLVWLWQHWDHALLALAAWVALSVPWVFVKWWLFVTDNRHRYDEVLAAFRDLPDKAGWPDDPNDFSAAQKVEWKEYFDAHACSGGWY